MRPFSGAKASRHHRDGAASRLGDLLGVVEIARGAVPVAGGTTQGGAGQQTARQMVIGASCTQAFNSHIEPGGSGARIGAYRGGRSSARQALQRHGEMGAAECQIVKRDVKNPILWPYPLQGPRCPVARLSGSPPGQQQVAITIPPERIQQGKARLRFPLPPFGVGEETRSLFLVAGAVKGDGVHGAIGHHPKRGARAVRKRHGFLCCRHGGGDVAEHQFSLAQI
jgi:hypothetical protein